MNTRIEFSVRTGCYDWLHPNEKSTAVHVRIGDYVLNDYFDEEDYDYWKERARTTDIEEQLAMINEVCEHVHGYLYSSQKAEAKAMQELLRRTIIKSALREFILERIEGRIRQHEKAIERLLRDKYNLIDIMRGDY